MKEHSPLSSVPVFNCLVHLRQIEGGDYEAIAVELSGIVGKGSTRRDALAQVVAQFKQYVSGFITRGEEIPWQRPAPPCAAGAQQMFIAVHL